jgi:hypothetical protein
MMPASGYTHPTSSSYYQTQRREEEKSIFSSGGARRHPTFYRQEYLPRLVVVQTGTSFTVGDHKAAEH